MSDHRSESGHVPATVDGDRPLGSLPTLEAHHEPRRADVDPKAARRAERQVATLFGLSALLVVAFVVAYWVIPVSSQIYIPLVGETSLLHICLGLSMGLSILLVGIGAIHWAKKLMPDVEVVAERHPQGATPEETAEAEAVFREGGQASGLPSRRLILGSMIGALALFPVPLVVLLRGLYTPPEGAPGPSAQLSETMWRSGLRIVTDGDQQPVKATDIPVGGLVNAIPEGLVAVQEATGTQNARAKAAIIVVRMTPGEIVSQQGDGWDYEGILAYSKICTHVGCPISLYEQRTHHLLCPCHQSTFDLSDAGKVVFGPAARPMPQLPIGVDADGYLIAKSDFQSPVGPSFWELSK